MTVEYLELNMSEEEFHRWMVYNKYEPLNALEIQIALLTTIVGSAVGGKMTFEDLMVSRSPYEVVSKVMSDKALNDFIKGAF